MQTTLHPFDAFDVVRLLPTCKIEGEGNIMNNYLQFKFEVLKDTPMNHGRFKYGSQFYTKQNKLFFQLIFPQKTKEMSTQWFFPSEQNVFFNQVRCRAVFFDGRVPLSGKVVSD